MSVAGQILAPFLVPGLITFLALCYLLIFLGQMYNTKRDKFLGNQSSYRWDFGTLPASYHRILSRHCCNENCTKRTVADCNQMRRTVLHSRACLTTILCFQRQSILTDNLYSSRPARERDSLIMTLKLIICFVLTYTPWYVDGTLEFLKNPKDKAATSLAYAVHDTLTYKTCFGGYVQSCDTFNPGSCINPTFLQKPI